MRRKLERNELPLPFHDFLHSDDVAALHLQQVDALGLPLQTVSGGTLESLYQHTVCGEEPGPVDVGEEEVFALLPNGRTGSCSLSDGVGLVEPLRLLGNTLIPVALGSSSRSVIAGDLYAKVDSETFVKLAHRLQCAFKPSIGEDDAQPALSNPSVVGNLKGELLQRLYVGNGGSFILAYAEKAFAMVGIVGQIARIELVVAVEVHPSSADTIAKIIVCIVGIISH